MTGIEMLKAEHQNISAAIDLLQNVCKLLADKEPVEPSHLLDLTRFFQLYADRVHHAKEESLFELLDGRDPQLDRMMSSLATQHVMARELLFGMLESADKYARGHARAARRFCDDATAYRTLLKIHICDEDHMLFPQFTKQLRGLQLAKVSREFAALDARLLAEPATSRCLKAVQKLYKSYRAEQTPNLQASR